jgi:translation initiation factor SUI1
MTEINNNYDYNRILDEISGVEIDTNGLIAIRTVKNEGRKTVTTISGFTNGSGYVKRLLKQLRQYFNCNGCLTIDDRLGFIIHLQGDIKNLIFDYLVSNERISRTRIVVF